MRKTSTFFDNPFYFRIFILLIIILIIGISIYFVASITRWKMVVLDNQQVYFGKGISLPFFDNLTLKNTHFIKQNNTNGDTDSFSQDNNLQIISVTEDLLAPDDSITINKDHIVYVQYLRRDSALKKALDERLDRE